MNFSIPDIFKLQFELAEFLYQLDPLSIGTVENNIRDEYSVEATKIINCIMDIKESISFLKDSKTGFEWPDTFEYNIVKNSVKRVFNEQFYPLQIADANIDSITKFIVEKLNNAH